MLRGQGCRLSFWMRADGYSVVLGVILMAVAAAGHLDLIWRRVVHAAHPPIEVPNRHEQQRTDDHRAGPDHHPVSV